jgi:hypothetical protein
LPSDGTGFDTIVSAVFGGSIDLMKTAENRARNTTLTNSSSRETV